MSNNRTRFEAAIDKASALKKADELGQVADSRAVRLALMSQVSAGEITLVEAQARLKKIKSGAQKAGLLTRTQAFSRG
jgi:hypothetical protein